MGQEPVIITPDAPPVTITPDAPPPGFGGRLASSLGIPKTLEELQNALPGSTGLGFLLGYGSNLYEKGKAFAQNPSLTSAADVGTALTPGGALQKTFAEDVANKNYSGAAGTATGVGLQFAAPELLERGGRLAGVAGSKARALYDALPDDLQNDLHDLATKAEGVLSPRIRNAIEFWQTSKRIRGHLADLANQAKQPSPELDATGENKPYAGEPAPKAQPWNANDATGENKPFAGGMDEFTAKPKRTLADLSSNAAPPEQVKASNAAPPKSAAQAQQPAPKAQTSKTPKPLPAGDVLLEKLRTIAAKIEADESADKTASTGEDDLSPLLLESLQRVRLQKAAQ